MRSSRWLTAVVLTIACSEPAPRPTTVAQPGGVRTAVVSAFATAPASASVVEPALPSPFRLVAELPSIDLHAVRGTLGGLTNVPASDEELAKDSYDLGTMYALVLKGNRFEVAAEFPAMPMLFSPSGLTGSKDRVDVVGTRMIERGSGPSVLGADPDGSYPGQWAGFASPEDNLIGLRIDLGGPMLHTLRGKLKLRQQPGPACAKYHTHTAVIPFALATTADGDIFLTGESCDGKPAAEVWVKSANPSKVLTLTGSLFVSLGGAFTIDGRSLSRWDGTRFVPVEPGLPEGLSEPFRSADGRTWASRQTKKDEWSTVLEEVWVLDGVAWHQVTLPAPKGKLLFDGERLWYAVNEKLYRETAAGAPDPEPITVALASTERVAPKPPPKYEAPGSKCKSHVVVLFGFTKVTPADFDFPLTRAALKGHTELEGVKFLVTQRADKRYFVAQTPSFDLAKKVAAVIEQGVQGSKPQVVCTEPEIVRELAIDLRTGNVKNQ